MYICERKTVGEWKKSGRESKNCRVSESHTTAARSAEWNFIADIYLFWYHQHSRSKSQEKRHKIVSKQEKSCLPLNAQQQVENPHLHIFFSHFLSAAILDSHCRLTYTACPFKLENWNENNNWIWFSPHASLAISPFHFPWLKKFPYPLSLSSLCESWFFIKSDGVLGSAGREVERGSLSFHIEHAISMFSALSLFGVEVSKQKLKLTWLIRLATSEQLTHVQ